MSPILQSPLRLSVLTKAAKPTSRSVVILLILIPGRRRLAAFRGLTTKARCWFRSALSSKGVGCTMRSTPCTASLQRVLWSALRPTTHPGRPRHGTLDRDLPLGRVDRGIRVLLFPLDPLSCQHGAVLHPDP